MGLGPPPTLITHSNMKFVIAGMPEPYSVRPYIQELMQLNTRKLIRVCEGNYDTSVFHMVGISVEELVYLDGDFPNPDVVNKWVGIVKEHFKNNSRGALAVHCRSGLGRAPVLVAIALMESGMKSQEAIELVRAHRRGCFSMKQFEELGRYKSKNRLCDKGSLPPRYFNLKRRSHSSNEYVEQ